MSVISELMEAALRAPRKGLLSFHASPFAFDKFSNKHLMKGEGAMVRGAGHYSGSSLEGEIAPRYWTGRNTFIGPDPKNPSASTVLPELDYREFRNDLNTASAEAYDLLESAIRRVGARQHEEMIQSAPQLKALPSRNSWINANVRDIANSDDAYEEALRSLERKLQDYPTEFVYGDKGLPHIMAASEGGGLNATDLAPTIRELLEGRRVAYNPGRGYALDLQVNPKRHLDFNASIEKQPTYTRDALLSSNDPNVATALNPTPLGTSGLRIPRTGGEFLENLQSLMALSSGGNIAAFRNSSSRWLDAQKKARDVLMQHGLDYTKYTPAFGGENTQRGVHYIVYDPKKIKILKMLSLAGITWASDELRRMGIDNQPDGGVDESGA